MAKTNLVKLQKWKFQYLPLLLQFSHSLHDLGPRGIDKEKGGERGAEELLIAVDLHALP